MSDRSAARVAWLLWTLCVTFLCAVGVFRALNWSVLRTEPRGPLALDVGILLLFLSFATVGALVASRQPGNPIGWIFCALGFLTPLAALGEEYALYALVTRPSTLPGAEVMVWIAVWVGGPTMISLLALVFLLFPNGRPPSRRWRPLIWVNLVAIALIFAWNFAPGPIENAGLPSVDNPFGVTGAGALFEILEPAGFLLALVGAVAGAISLIVRLRRSRGDERQQLKWFVFAGAVFCAVFATGPVLWSLPPSPETTWVWPMLFLLGVGAIPVAAAIAILKYRLYDIDLVINRTLVYASLTALLALVYFGGVTATQAIFQTFTGQEELPQLAVVVSTLVIAALFNPLRRRIQSFIDRRFYRGKYDAAKTLEAFSSKLRDETDLNALNDDLVRVVRETVQPTHVSLWLRFPTEVGRGGASPG
jgi:hypothetical protein